MKDFEEVVDEKKAEEDAKKLLSGNFNLHDFVEQIKHGQEDGPAQGPAGEVPALRRDDRGLNLDEKELAQIEAIFDSMTDEGAQEAPTVIDDARIERIAKGSGRERRTSTSCCSASR